MLITGPQFSVQTPLAQKARNWYWQSCVCGAITGTLVALLAWYPGNWRVALLALPAASSALRNRTATLALWSSYYLTGARDIPVVCARFFSGYGELDTHTAFVLGILFWFSQAILLAFLWVLLKPGTTAPAVSHAWCAALVTLLVTVPPLGIIGWLSPVHIASTLYPGWRPAGLILGMLTLSVAAAARHSRRALAAFPILLAISVCAHWRNLPRALPTGWTTVSTAFGRFDQSNYDALYARTVQTQQLTQHAFDTHADVVILPEEIVGLWRPAMRWWWQGNIGKMRETGKILIIGMDLPISSTPFRYTDSAVIVGAGDGRVDSRQPVPAALWRPGAQVSAIRGGLLQPYVSIAGKRTAFSLCYEDLLWWPHWRTLVERPDIIVSMSNGWLDPDLALATIQRQGIESVARLAGAPLLRATNR